MELRHHTVEVDPESHPDEHAIDEPPWGPESDGIGPERYRRRMTAVDLNGITIEYERTGTGEPLLLVMGLAGQLTSWPPELVEALVAEGFEVIRFDNRDAGLSTEFSTPPMTPAAQAKAMLTGRAPDPGYTLSDMADDAAALLDHLGIGSAHVVGASMGGMIAQLMAIEHPAKVRSLCSIMSTTGSRRVGRMSPMLLPAYARIDRDPAKRFEASMTIWRSIAGPHFDAERAADRIRGEQARSYRPAGVSRQTMAIINTPDRTGALRTLDVPTLVIHGMRDLLVMPSGGMATAEAVPGSRLLMFNDMAHDLPLPRVGEIASAIAENSRRAVPVAA